MRRMQPRKDPTTALFYLALLCLSTGFILLTIGSFSLLSN